MVKRYQERETTIENNNDIKETRDNLRVMYTNIDGIVSSFLELKDYIRNNNPDVICLTETKLKEEIQLGIISEGYNTWRKDRKGKCGGGVLIMVKDDILVEEVEFRDGMAEVLSIVIQTKDRERRKIIVTYVPPKTNAWELENIKRCNMMHGGV